MVAFTGAIIDGYLGPETNNWASGIPASVGKPVNVVDGGAYSFDGKIGDITFNQPPERLVSSFNGHRDFTYSDDFYDRVWFIPGRVEFGAIGGDTSVQVYLWNAQFHDVTFVGIDTDNDDESVQFYFTDLEINGIKKLGTEVITVTALAFGDVSIDADFDFTFSPSFSYELSVTGVRARVWGFMPNWKDGFEMSLEYRSDIITSRSGKEQRIANRQTPRKEMSFQSVVHEEGFREFIRYMSAWQNLPTMMPEFTRSAHIEAADASDNEITIIEDADWMIVGQTVGLIKGGIRGSEYVIRRITEVDGNTATLNGTLDQDWVAGSRVYPMVSGRISTSITTNQRTNRTAVVAVKFSADPASEIERPVGEPVVTHLDREVFLRRPNWADSMSPEFQAILEKVDYGIGRVTNFQPVRFNDRLHKANYLGLNRESSDDLIRFFMRQSGQVGEFFMPTFTEDLMISAMSAATTSTLRLDGDETAQDYKDGTVYRDLIVFMADGTYFTRHVVDISVAFIGGSPGSIIQVDEPWPVDITPTNVKQICWMPLWRFNTDLLTVSWVTDQAAEIAMSMKTLEYVEAED